MFNQERKKLKDFFRNRKDFFYLLIILSLTGFFTYKFWNSKTFVLMSGTLAITLYFGYLSMRTPTLELTFEGGKDKITLEPTIYDLQNVWEYSKNKAKELHPKPGRTGNTLFGNAKIVPDLMSPSGEQLQKYYMEWMGFTAKMQSVKNIRMELKNNSAIRSKDIEVIIDFPDSWNIGSDLPQKPDGPDLLSAPETSVVTQLSQIRQQLEGRGQAQPQEIDLEENKAHFFISQLNPYHSYPLEILVEITEGDNTKLPYTISYSDMTRGELQVTIQPNYQENFDALTEEYKESEIGK